MATYITNTLRSSSTVRAEGAGTSYANLVSLAANANETVTSGEQTAPMSQTEFTLLITTTEVNESVTVSFTGDDGPTIAWAGCYGPAIRNVSLSGVPSFAPELKWIELNEGWSGELSAPSGVFTSIIFASYGTPSGQDGQYSMGSCHAQNSLSIIESIVIGQQSVTLSASNGIFGDPCGGTYKRLFVAAEYTPTSAPTTTTSTTTTLPSCGPYDNITVTGKSGGAVWGSGPYTDDSDFGVVAVHAGLAEVGQTVTLVPSNIAYHLSYQGSTANGVTTDTWSSGWCGYDVSLVLPPTTTSTTTIPQTTTTQESTTTLTSTTTTSEAPAPEKSTTIPETVPEEVTTTVDTSVPETTTTQETVPQEEITTPETSTAPDPTPETTEPEPSPTTTEPEEVPPTIQEQDAAETTIPEPAPEPQNEEATDAEVALEALSSAEELTDEQLVEAVDAVLADGITAEAVSELVDAIESGTLEADQVQAVVDAILEEEITDEVAAELATSPEVIQNVTQEQATEIFAAIDEGALTEEQGAAIVAAVQDAPTEVRQAFEAQINIFGGVTDTYVPVGSNVSVGVRRVIVAATAAVFVAPAAASASRRR